MIAEFAGLAGVVDDLHRDAAPAQPQEPALDLPQASESFRARRAAQLRSDLNDPMNSDAKRYFLVTNDCIDLADFKSAGDRSPAGSRPAAP
jgi:hypothetical protein